MRALRTGIGLQGYGQRDPLIEYKREGFNIFQQLLTSINQEITYTFFKYAHHAAQMKVQTELNQSMLNRSGVTLEGVSESGEAVTVATQPQPTTTTASSTTPDSSTGRNDLCPCGSGKKYKKCHGA
jgi:preprotein translocase subunit SecA